ncbi:hypothetical protein BD626DRAFT_14072 [Schizophyllum amplum]|uniref:Uncharacterized protein n=1 Tax=Schizophyllum amplum TaxID=97359 RepID=A0A550CXM7_9AGAR|nr:hypothetical protein BD626DRAFT_14072 [Auriculariopsis ampla]
MHRPPLTRIRLHSRVMLLSIGGQSAVTHDPASCEATSGLSDDKIGECSARSEPRKGCCTSSQELAATDMPASLSLLTSAYQHRAPAQRCHECHCRQLGLALPDCPCATLRACKFVLYWSSPLERWVWGHSVLPSCACPRRSRYSPHTAVIGKETHHIRRQFPLRGI